MKNFIILQLIFLSFIAIGHDPSISTCGPRVYEKGIGVGNNNYQGRNCFETIERTETTTVAPVRTIASDKSTHVILESEDFNSIDHSAVEFNEVEEPLHDYSDEE